MSQAHTVAWPVSAKMNGSRAVYPTVENIHILNSNRSMLNCHGFGRWNIPPRKVDSRNPEFHTGPYCSPNLGNGLWIWLRLFRYVPAAANVTAPLGVDCKLPVPCRAGDDGSICPWPTMPGRLRLPTPARSMPAAGSPRCCSPIFLTFLYGTRYCLPCMRWPYCSSQAP